MTIETARSFPTDAIRLYVLPSEFKDFSTLTGAADLPGMQTAWEQIPDDKYRTLFGPEGTVAYLLKTPLAGATSSLRNLARKLTHRERERLSGKIAIYWDGGSDERLEAFVNGLFLGTYRTGRWKETAETHPLGALESRVYFVGSSTEDQVNVAGRSYQLTDTQQRCMDLVNAPANKKRPQMLADWALESARRFGYEARVMDKAACAEAGFHALLAVNRGSEDPACFIIQEYRGPDAPERPTILCGKGVTFDTGGISIKGSANLHLMKSDMGGAAAVLGTLEAAARLRLPVHLIGLVPATDNSVDALAIKPSDVINSHSGKTIEIIDTDAEGRLILSDALSYAVTNWNPETLIDLATLTGSAVRTFGYECAALFTKNDELAEELRVAGRASDEKLWPLPMWPAYRAGLNSDVADIKNFSGKPINGAIDAAIFLETFTQEHDRYAHLDIAGVALKAGPYAGDRLATGFGINLLIRWLQS